MVSRSAALLFFVMSSLGQAVQIRVATFNVGSSYDDSKTPPYQPSLGAPGTSDYEIIRATITRLDPDVIALQELHVSDVNAGNVSALASSLGYGHVYVAPSTNAFDTTLRLAFFSRFPFLSQTSIASPVGAREMTRLIPAVKVDVPGTSRDPWLFSVHLKAEGGEEADPFRRAVEMRRLTSHINASGLTNDDNFVLLGDFNPAGSPETFNTLPTVGLPGSFDLGSDIPFPIFYFTDPRNYFTTPAVHLLDPRQVNGSALTSTASTLDLILTSPVIATRPLATEIYNSVLDTSNDVGLPKYGSPLPSGSSATASDHRPVFADIELDPAVPHTFTAPGQTITDNFAGFPGTYDPYPWTTSGGSWQRSDNGSVMSAGFRAYGPSTDPSLGFRPSGAPGTATAAFMNGSPSVLSALRISFTAEQWHSAFGGTADTLGVEFIVGGGATPLPALTFHAAINLPNGAVANGTSTVKEATITGLAIAQGTPFHLRFNFTPGAGSSTPPSAVFINELNYDDNGADDEEFVEIVAGPGFTGALSSVTLLLYNGANGQTYGSSHALSTFTTGAITPSGHRIFSKAISSLQNGEPDGLALVVNGVVTQFISYEGQFQATNGAASGRMSTDIGVIQTGEDPGGTSSLGLTGIGGAAGPLWWTKFASQPYSQGQPNPGQTFTNNNLPPQGIAIDNLAVTFLTGGDTDGDGFSDADEAVFGTNPADAGSRFIVNFAHQTPAPGMVRLLFPTLTGRSYLVESCTDFSDWEEAATYSGTGAPQIADFPVSSADPKRFYRIRATLQ